MMNLSLSRAGQDHRFEAVLCPCVSRCPLEVSCVGPVIEDSYLVFDEPRYLLLLEVLRQKLELFAPDASQDCHAGFGSAFSNPKCAHRCECVFWS
jgi:hypothetical protein